MRAWAFPGSFLIEAARRCIDIYIRIIHTSWCICIREKCNIPREGKDRSSGRAIDYHFHVTRSSLRLCVHPVCACIYIYIYMQVVQHEGESVNRAGKEAKTDRHGIHV